MKPHGALYNHDLVDPEQAAAVVDAVAAYDPSLPIVGLPDGAVLRQAAEPRDLRRSPRRSPTVPTPPDGRLVPRRERGSLVTDPAVAAPRAVRIVTDGVVEDVHGDLIALSARTLCVHGDTPGAAGILRAVRRGLEDVGVAVAPFVPSVG